MIIKYLEHLWSIKRNKLINENLNPLMIKHNEPIKDLLRVQELRRFIYQYINYPEFIIRAAIAEIDKSTKVVEHIYSVSSPGHHAEVIAFLNQVVDVNKNPRYSYTQGFLTNQGLFVDRQAALVIANQAKQVLRKHGSTNELFSEDMWNLTGECHEFRKLYIDHPLNKIIDILRKNIRIFKWNFFKHR